MARATKTRPPMKSGKTKKGMSGVNHDATGPTYDEKIPEPERGQLGLQLAEATAQLEELKAEHKEIASEQRAEREAVQDKVNALSEQIRTGIRKKPAQQTLDGVEP